MAARNSVAATTIFTRTRSTGRYKQPHHQRVLIERMVMADSIATIVGHGKEIQSWPRQARRPVTTSQEKLAQAAPSAQPAATSLGQCTPR